MTTMSFYRSAALSLLCSLVACGPYPGPDKQGAGLAEGAVVGAGAGAVTGFQLGAGTGPGAVVGAGLGAVAGSIQGMARDQTEEELLALSAATQDERHTAFAQELLQEHLRRRMELHPTRDIYPADWFFEADAVRLRPEGRYLVREIARLNKDRYPWSRLVVAAYVRTSDKEAEYARYLGSRRCSALGDQFVKEGFEPRRVETRVVLMSEPVLIDPHDRPNRYDQAIELIAVDR